MYTNLLNIVTDLLNCSELTVGNYYCIMNMYNYRKISYSVNVQIFNKFYVYSIVTENSGNFEKVETHYILNLDDYGVTKLNKIIFLISQIIDSRYNFKDEFKDEYLKVLNILKLKEERKYKIKNL